MYMYPSQIHNILAYETYFNQLIKDALKLHHIHVIERNIPEHFGKLISFFCVCGSEVTFPS